MAVAVTSSASSLASLRSRVPISKFGRNAAHRSCSLFAGPQRGSSFVSCSIKLSGPEYFGEPNKITNYLSSLAVILWDTSSKSKPLKEFPWGEAKVMVAQHLISLSKNALKWSFIAWFVIGFIWDVSRALSVNKELMIPLGLFMGVMLADFLKESLQEFFRTSIKDVDFKRLLLGIGGFFVLVKFTLSSFKIPGLVLLSHIGNGGLMQVLWLAKELQETKSIEDQGGETLDAPAPASGCKD